MSVQTLNYDLSKFAIAPNGERLQGGAYGVFASHVTTALAALPRLVNRHNMTAWEAGDVLRPIHQTIQQKSFATLCKQVFDLSPRTAHSFITVREAYAELKDVPRIGKTDLYRQAAKIVREKKGRSAPKARGATKVKDVPKVIKRMADNLKALRESIQTVPNVDPVLQAITNLEMEVNATREHFTNVVQGVAA